MLNLATKKDIEQLRAALEKKPDKLEKDVYERLADLEIKMTKLWTLLLEQTPRGQERLSKIGRKFGGMSYDRLQH